MMSIAGHATLRMASLPPEMCVLKREFRDNHKIIIMSLRVATYYYVTRKPMVCESLGKELVVQGEDTSPLVHST